MIFVGLVLLEADQDLAHALLGVIRLLEVDKVGDVGPGGTIIGGRDITKALVVNPFFFFSHCQHHLCLLFCRFSQSTRLGRHSVKKECFGKGDSGERNEPVFLLDPLKVGLTIGQELGNLALGGITDITELGLSVGNLLLDELSVLLLVLTFFFF